jgi:8-oxo-dGTP pyrophosphatase MutT (NUDIX family)
VVLARGPFTVRAREVPSTLDPAGLEPRVAARWAAARAASPGIYDGPLARVESWRCADGVLDLALSRTGYRMFLGTNAGDLPAPCALARPQRADALGTSALLIDADGRRLLGRRSARVALYPGLVHPFGGCVEHPDRDPVAELLRELAEELGVTEAEIRATTGAGLLEDPWLLQPELVVRVDLTVPAAALAARLDRHEHTALVVIDGDAPPADLTPIAEAVLALARAGPRSGACPPSPSPTFPPTSSGPSARPGPPPPMPPPTWAPPSA